MTPPPDRVALWLPLLRQLTLSAPSWLVWKNVDSAFYGTGDIDAAARPDDWSVIVREFHAWAEDAGVGPVFECHHIPGGLNLIAVPAGLPTFLEMGVKERRYWRGSTLFVVDDLLPMTVQDDRGFRRLPTGAEGLFKLLLNGTRRGGAPNEEALAAKGVREQLRADPGGIRLAARLLGPARHAAVVGARHAAADGWSRPAMLAVEGWAIARAATHPQEAATRLQFRRRGRATCPIVDGILSGGRQIPADRESWIERLARDHPWSVDAARTEAGGA